MGQVGPMYCNVGVYIIYRINGDFRKMLAEIDKVIRARKGQIFVIAEDFNAKKRLWESPRDDGRGQCLLEWAGIFDFVVINNKGLATCENPRGKSRIDITMTNAKAADYINDWNVEERESLF